MKNNEKLLQIELNYFLSKSKEIEKNIREIRITSENIKGDLNKIYSLSDFLEIKSRIFKKLNLISDSSDEIMNVYSKLNGLISIIHLNGFSLTKLAEEEESSILFTNTHKDMINKNEIFESMILKTEPNMNFNQINNNFENAQTKVNLKHTSKNELNIERTISLNIFSKTNKLIHNLPINRSQNVNEKINNFDENQFSTINDLNIASEVEKDSSNSNRYNEIKSELESREKNKGNNNNYDISEVLKKNLKFNYDYSKYNDIISNESKNSLNLKEIDNLIKHKTESNREQRLNNNNIECIDISDLINRKSINEMNKVNIIGNSNSPLKNNVKELDNNHSLSNSKSNATLANLKASKISDIILKISKDSNLNNYIKDSLGINFLDKLLDSDVTIKNISDVESIIEQFENNSNNIKNTLNDKKYVTNKTNESNIEENNLFESHSEIFPRVNHPCFYPYYGLDNNYSILRNNEDLEKSFSHSRYRVISSSMSDKLKIENPKRLREPFESRVKQYSNYVKKQPRFFDRSYQYGGASSINIKFN